MVKGLQHNRCFQSAEHAVKARTHGRFCDLVVLLICGLAVTSARAGLAIPEIFTDHAVLQAEKPVSIWGTAEPGQTVTVSFAGQVVNVRARQHGSWLAQLEPMKPAGSGRDLVVESEDERLVR